MQFADGMDVMYQGRKESRVISKLLDWVAGLMVLPPDQTGKTDGRVVGEKQVFCFRGVTLKMSGGSQVWMFWAWALLMCFRLETSSCVNNLFLTTLSVF